MQVQLGYLQPKSAKEHPRNRHKSTKSSQHNECPNCFRPHFTPACHMTRTFNTQVSTGCLGMTLGRVILWRSLCPCNKRILARFWQVLFRLLSLFELWFWCKLNMFCLQWGWLHLSLYIPLRLRHSKVWLQQRSYWANLSQKTYVYSMWSINPYICHKSGRYLVSTIRVFLASHKIGPTVCSINGRMVKGTSCRAALK